MRRQRLDVIGLAMMSLVAALLWYGGSPLRAQEAPKEVPGEMPPLELPADGKGPLATLSPPVAPGCPAADGQKKDGCGGDQKKDGAPKSIWDKVPPPFPYTKIGGIFVLPTGPGYYSFWDLLAGNYREKPPVFPVIPFGLQPPIPFFDANYRYLDKPGNDQTSWTDFMKRIHLGDNWMLTFGGELRIRYNNEVDSRLSGKNNVFESYRSRVFGDLWYRDLFRVYVEYIDANVSNQDLPPSPTDINKSDLLNLFAEAKLFRLGDEGVYVRGGRQELYFGSQRLVSPTDFPNAIRTWDGVKGYWHSSKLDVDAFWTRPVVIDPTHFDSPNNSATFAGAWGTYKPAKGQFIDLYYLYLDNSTPLVAKPLPGQRGGFDVNTIGSRTTGNYKFLLWDFEGMYQFGQHTNQETSAGAADLGLGTNFANVPLNPTFWVYFDYASGNHNPGQGGFGTFNQLFPNGHAYFGGTDLVGRQNIQDLNFNSWINPLKWILVGAQYHILRLDSAKDALYNAAGAVSRVDPTGKAGTDVGQVFTTYTNFHLSAHSDLLLQYSHLYAGQFIQRTGPPGSPDQFYLQYSFRW